MSLEWLVESDEAQKPLPETKYVFDDQKDGDTEKSTKKRSLEDALDMNGTSKKKSKSDQKAGSKPVNVEVDEASPYKREIHFGVLANICGCAADPSRQSHTRSILMKLA